MPTVGCHVLLAPRKVACVLLLMADAEGVPNRLLVEVLATGEWKTVWLADLVSSARP